MKILKIETDALKMVAAAMGKTEMFGALKEDSLIKIASRAKLCHYDPQENIVKENEPSEAFFMLIKGEVSILHHHKSTDGMIELGRIKPNSIIGEIGLLLKEPRTATVQATQKTLILKFDRALFEYMFENIPAFGPSISQNLARRVEQLSTNIPLPAYDKDSDLPSPDIIQMLPLDFIIRHRVLPLQATQNVLRIGLVNDPSSKVLGAVRSFLPSMELQMVRIDNDFFDTVLGSQAGVEEWSASTEKPEKDEKKGEDKSSPKLDTLLKRMVAEGASDLHLSAGQIPHWRIDGEIQDIADTKKVGAKEVFELLDPVMGKRSKNQFLDQNDTDFVYSVSDVGRFRVNLFRDDLGIGAVFRFIPTKILSFEQLGLPLILKKLSDHPKGLVLITGPTGSGKSTTLAAMIDYINRTRRAHIVTMEDPIEYVHLSKLSLINQREIGRHTNSFSSALRAAFREDPDIVLVGELRDSETISLAIETANTGHLVFGTLHTNSAISALDRIIDSFPPDQQSRVRVGLCDSLKGIVAQVLCKCIGGGRAAAVEVLVVNSAVANLVREEKINQIKSTMQTGKAQGNMLMNEELAKLVRRKKVDYKEALSKAEDKDDLVRRLEN
ncbi:MAG: PilT/PilU family type 4a pilus ATPase [Thermodesulfobacteriota bacterium]|nr:PilT/PilU family type 4a pilus ATPase [Thermodesulfobacteriota bacterium]